MMGSSWLALAALLLTAQAAPVAVPDWALPGSATHDQVAPPSGFHRPTRTDPTLIGMFEGQSDVGGALVPGGSSFDPAGGRYRVTSAGYNIWYGRDEFRFLWRRMAGDVSLAADIQYPDPAGYGDRKAVLVIRQSLDDDSPEALVALHGGGMIHLARRGVAGARMTDTEYRIGGRGRPEGRTPDSLVPVLARRIGIEKRGDQFTLYVSQEGEPMHPYGPPITLHLPAPFYVGIGFCSHQPTTRDTADLSRVMLANAAGKVL
ncbi:MAG: hypothetical protein ACRYFW_03650 [Janthinobacterium lividum]